MQLRPSKNTLALLLMAFLFLPMLQQLFGFVQEKPLGGVAKTVNKPVLTLDNWLGATYQDSLVKYLNHSIGFHNSLIRLNNQYFYSIFGTAAANGVIVGKEYRLYDPNQINAYTGADFIGTTRIRNRMQKLVDIQTVLNAQGKKLLIVIVPGKATGLPEYLPEGTPGPAKITNSSEHIRLADSMGVPVLDLITWYHQKKKVEKYPLYPGGGVHWSMYCAALAADTLFGHLGQMFGRELNRFDITKVTMEPAERDEDDDVSRGMNLIFHLPTRPAAYHEFKWQQKPKQLKVLTVGDSFYFRAYAIYSGMVFEQSHYWFYYEQLYKYGDNAPILTPDVDFSKEIADKDLIMLYANDANMARYGWGFIDRLWSEYFDNTREILRIANDIRNDPVWMAQIVEKAAKKGIPVDSMLKKDAIWVYEQR